jgi:hypothetical protein
MAQKLLEKKVIEADGWIREADKLYFKKSLTVPELQRHYFAGRVTGKTLLRCMKKQVRSREC